MGYEYAGSLFDSATDRAIAKTHDFMTATGTESTREAQRAWWSEREDILDEAVESGWFDELDRDDIADVIDEWDHEVRCAQIRQIRDDLSMTQQAMADMLSLSGQQRIYEYEKGLKTPGKQVVMLAEMMAQQPELWT